MGISVQQYRAVIGSWNAKKLVLKQPGRDLVEIDHWSTDQNQECDFVIRGPWKIHTLLLVLFLIISIMCSVPQSRPLPTVDYEMQTSTKACCPLDYLTCSSISAQCHEALLMISGIEPNPGPSDEDIVAQLCVDADDDAVRDCLRKYDLTNTTAQHKTAFGKEKKPTLVATLAYLGVPDQDNETRPTCINNLICRIQNFLPDTCNICDTEYHVELQDTPLLECEKCGQGSHNECILLKLGVEKQDEPNFGPTEAQNKLNPSGIAGVHYLCGACEELMIPKKGAGLLKRKSKNHVGDDDALDANLRQTVEEKDVQDDDLDLPPDDRLKQTNDAPVKVPSKTAEDGDHKEDRSKGSDQQKVCRYYQRGTCRYGISGKRCPDAHPKPCNKLLKHGNKGPLGCTLGKSNCAKFHPKMCASSLSKGVCLTTNCTLRHVSGTKMPLKDSSDQQTNGRTKQHEKPAHRKAPAEKVFQGTTPADFLELFRLLKGEIMEAMDVKLESRLSNQTATHSNLTSQPRPVMTSRTKGNPGAVDQTCPGVCPCQQSPWQTTHRTNPAHSVGPGWPHVQEAAHLRC